MDFPKNLIAGQRPISTVVTSHGYAQRVRHTVQRVIDISQVQRDSMTIVMEHMNRQIANVGNRI